MKIICFFRYTLFSGILLFVFTLTVKAQIEVSTLAGDGSRGSLITAIQSANAQKTTPDKPITIHFAKNLSGEIVLSMDLPTIENHVSIIGNLENGNPAVTINGSVNPAINEGLKGGISPGFRLFAVKSGNTASFENLHLTKSNQSGIANEGGTVTVKNCILTYNVGIGNIHGTAGAIQNERGNLTVIASYFFYNTGGVGGTDGGIGYGGGGSIDVVDGNAVIINSSFLDNEGGFGGVGVGSIGGAGVIMVRNGNVSISNCTLAGNFGGGSIVTGASGGIVMVGGNMVIQQSTIVDNLGGAGLGGFDGVDFCSGGIHVLSGTLALGGNILVGNHNGADKDTDLESQKSGTINSLGNNIVGITEVVLNESNDIKGAKLMNVVATTSEGKYSSGIISGFLPTVSLSANSPAKNQSTGITNISPVLSTDINAKFFTDAWSNYSSLLQADQNGRKRESKPNIGAVE